MILSVNGFGCAQNFANVVGSAGQSILAWVLKLWRILRCYLNCGSLFFKDEMATDPAASLVPSPPFLLVGAVSLSVASASMYANLSAVLNVPAWNRRFGEHPGVIMDFGGLATDATTSVCLCASFLQKSWGTKYQISTTEEGLKRHMRQKLPACSSPIFWFW